MYACMHVYMHAYILFRANKYAIYVYCMYIIYLLAFISLGLIIPHTVRIMMCTLLVYCIL